MSTLSDLYLIREALQPALAALFATATGAPVYTELASETKVDPPWLELEYDPGQFGSHRYPCPDGVCRRDYLEGALVVLIRSKFGEAGADNESARAALNAEHQQLRAKAISVIADKLTTDRHQILFTRLTGQRTGEDESNCMQTTELRWDIHACIRPAAWLPALVHTADTTLATADTDLLTADHA